MNKSVRHTTEGTMNDILRDSIAAALVTTLAWAALFGVAVLG